VFQSAYPDLFRRHRLDEHGSYRDPRAIAQWNKALDPMAPDGFESLCTHLRMPGA
jgi:hypothetical protein